MTGFIAILIVILLGVILIQIGRVSELTGKIRGEEEAERQANNRQALWLLLFMVAFLILSVSSAIYYKNDMLGYGPLKAASAHGGLIDSMFNVTLVLTGIVFIITQILTFWYSYKYRRKDGVKAKFLAHNTTVEIVWTAIPALAMTLLVAQGLTAWNQIMDDVPSDEALTIEATGYQFAWDIRYPGPDQVLGTKNYKLIRPGLNDLGLNFDDVNTLDDIVLSGSDKIVLPVDTTVKVQITSKDVLHNFYLPHFRVKMDAVPGLPTYFVFKPIKTTEQFRQELKKYPEWREPYDPTDPESKEKWEEFNYELACAELCGKGHYSMKRIIEVVSKEDYKKWIAEKKSFYASNIRNSDIDPYKGKLLNYEIMARKTELSDAFSAAIAPDATDDLKTIRLKHVFYNTGSASLSDLSKYELDNVVRLLNANPDVMVQLAGHTDSVGDDEMNLNLSQSRANNVLAYITSRGISDSRLSASGYGETEPIDSNESEEGRANNRRTELRIITK